MQRIVIFGAGDIGKRSFDILNKDYDILAYADNNARYAGRQLYGRPIVTPNEISLYNPELIIIAMARFGTIGIQLQKLGYNNIFVLSFVDNGFDIDDYRLEKFENSFLYRNYSLSTKTIPYKNIKNKNHKNKKVLMIAYNYPPEGGPAVQRTLKFSKYLHNYGYTPVVLTCGGKEKFMKDEELVNEIPSCVEVIRIKDKDRLSWTDAVKNGQKLYELFRYVYNSDDFMAELVHIQTKCSGYLIPDYKLLWELNCIEHIEEYLDFDSVDIVYSTVPSFSQHILGAFFKLKYGIPWVADYRDLWTSDETYHKLYYPSLTDDEISLFRKLEKKLTEYMDFVVLAGGNWIKGFEDTFGVQSDKICEITNGYDEEDFAGKQRTEEKNEQFTLCYNGRLIHNNRNPEGLIKVINELIEEGKIDQQKIRWIVNGQITSVYKCAILSSDKYSFVKINGVRSHRECINDALNSDLLVFYGEGGENGRLNYPGKFYEYLRSGTRILCFSGRGSFQEKVLEETELGSNFDYNEKEKIKQFIYNEYSKWYTSKMKENRDPTEKIGRFERQNLTKQLSKVFDRVLDCYKNDKDFTSDKMKHE